MRTGAIIGGVLSAAGLLFLLVGMLLQHPVPLLWVLIGFIGIVVGLLTLAVTGLAYRQKNPMQPGEQTAGGAAFTNVWSITGPIIMILAGVGLLAFDLPVALDHETATTWLLTVFGGLLLVAGIGLGIAFFVTRRSRIASPIDPGHDEHRDN